MQSGFFITKEQAVALGELFAQYKLSDYDGDVSVYLSQREP